MREPSRFSRRSFLAASVMSPLLGVARGAREVPIGLELYSVRDALKKDDFGTIRAVAKEGYQCVEFYAPYYEWTPEHAKQMRGELDELSVRCYSTHNDMNALTADGINKAIELNQALGTKYVVLAHPGNVHGADGWKRVVETLNTANDALKSHGLHAGYHNHDVEWKPLDDGHKPLEYIADNTDKSIMLQLDVGTCLETGNDPVAWINSHPGRIRSMHLKDWSPDKGYRVLLGEGTAPWKKIFAAGESSGGVEYYLVEQEGSQYSELETAERCLAEYRKLHG